MNDNKYKEGDIVKHRKGGFYEVIGYGYLEESLATYVAYKSCTTGQLWFRNKEEFEDGRFVLVNELCKKCKSSEKAL